MWRNRDSDHQSSDNRGPAVDDYVTLGTQGQQPQYDVIHLDHGHNTRHQTHNSGPAADYETLSEHTRGPEPQYDVVQRDKPVTDGRHPNHNYENL